MDLWKYLKTNNKPIVLYGTGNGAEKIIKMLDTFEIKVSGIFASDGFVRGKTFAGFPVTSYSDAKATFTDMIVLVCFGSDRSEVIDNILRIASEQELYMPDVPVITNADGSFDVFDDEYEQCHKKELDLIYNNLTDELSRKTFMDIISYKKSGDIHFLFDCESREEEIFDLLGLNDNETYLDLGAYTGDTIEKFVDACQGHYNSIYAFEPDARNFRKLAENTKDLPNCRIYNLAVSNTKEKVSFLKNSGRGGVKNGNAEGRSKLIEIDADSVDNILAGDACTLIKIDVEGQEKKAIEGAENIIKTQAPKMIVAAYHRTEDLYEIPLQVLRINPNYKVYLRRSPCLPAWEVNYIFI